MRIRAVLVVSPVIAVFLFAMAGPASCVGQLTVSNAAPSPGTAIAMSSTGWSPGHAVTIALSGTEGILGRATADATGSVRARVTVPADAALERDQLSVTGTAMSGVPQQIVTSLVVHRAHPAPAPVRPWAAALVLAAIAGALLVAGVTTPLAEWRPARAA